MFKKQRPRQVLKKFGYSPDRSELEMGVIIPSTFNYYNEMERYARYLELKLRFYEYEHMTKEEREVLDAKVEKHNDECEAQSGIQPDGGNLYVIPDCMFSCGTAPCGCERDWSEYNRLKPLYENVSYKKGDNNYCIHFNVQDIAKLLDTNKNYHKCNFMFADEGLELYFKQTWGNR